MLPLGWGIAASPAASLLAGVVALVFLVRCGFHRDVNGDLIRRRLATVLLLSAAMYTFCVLTISELMLGGPELSVLIRDGFGNERVGWLMVGASLDYFSRVWDEFRAA